MAIRQRFLAIFGLICVTFVGSAPVVEQCGVSKLLNEPQTTSAFSDTTSLFKSVFVPQPNIQIRDYRIVGGTEARPHAWPWMAALIRGNYFICGAVLIDPQFVVTAAHCVIERPYASSYRIILGAHNIYQGYVYNVTALAYNTNFNTRYPPRNSDIAILRLDRPADLSKKEIGIVCMPTFFLDGGRECVATGWGRTSEGGPPSTKLLEVKLPILDNYVCNDWKHYRNMIDNTMLCAGWETGGKDTCQGDSGGPLVCEVNGVWQLHGLSSWGYGCARPSRPGVYARVFSLQSWITMQMTKLRSDL